MRNPGDQALPEVLGEVVLQPFVSVSPRHLVKCIRGDRLRLPHPSNATGYACMLPTLMLPAGFCDAFV